MSTQKPKNTATITTEVNEAAMTILFKVKDAGEITLSLTKISEANRTKAMFHGMTQRISDAAAISRNAETGKPASPQDKLKAMQTLVEFYETGTAEWTRKRAAGEGAGYSNGLLVQCLKRLYVSKTAEQIETFVKGLKPSERVALLASDKIRVIADEIRAEAAKETKVDAEALLAGLEDAVAVPGAVIEGQE